MQAKLYTFRSDAANLTVSTVATLEMEALAQLAFTVERTHGLPRKSIKNFTLVGSKPAVA